jgi:LmbE family N-acetylglucosaminyl deacetylase
MSPLPSPGARRAQVPASYSTKSRANLPAQASTVLAAGLLALACLSVAQPARADVLVVAPHPDDDLITSAGVMLRARQAGETVRVMFMTNGDISGMTSGLMRQDEAVAAETLLGVAEGNMIFLGYPDGGLQDLRGPFFASSTAMTGNSGLNHTFGDRGLGGMDYHRFAFGSSANNNGTNVITDIAHVLSTYRPSDIFVTSEFDQHPDHAATYQFVIDGIASARSSSPSYNPTVHKTIVWNDFSNTDAWPLAQDPSTYHIEPPSLLSRTGLVWSQRESLDVPLDAQVTTLTANLKWRAINAHESQGGAGLGSYIGQFVHKDEWFFTARATGGNRPPVPNAGTDRTASAGASVQLNGSASFDPDGTALTYQWRQTSGPSVTLSSASAAQPTFTVPASTTTATAFAFELKVSDGTSTSVADGVSVLVNSGTTPPPPGGSNLALTATASASTQSGGQEASKVRDGFTDGYPANATHEWSSNGQGAGAWVQLTWSSAQTIDRVVLFDRPNADDRVMSGTLSFSSGASVPVGALDNGGAALAVPVSSRSVTWVRFTVNTVAATTYNVGLAELQVFNTGGTTQPPPSNQPPVAVASANQTVAQGAAVTLSAAGSSDPEGSALTYAWSQLSGTGVTLSGATSASATFSAPSGSSTAQTLVFQLVVNDGSQASSPVQTSVTVNPPSTPPPGGSNLALSATASASTQAGGQEASKVRDGFTDGYPTDASHEWASNGQGAGAWVQLTWPTATAIDRVVLFDRPNADDRVMSGTLTFSSGASVAVGALDNAGAALTVPFSARSVSWVRFTVNTVSATTYNVGLAELQAFNSGGTTPPPPTNQPPVAVASANQTVGQSVAVALSAAGSSDPEGSALTYAWSQVSGPSVTLAGAATASASFTTPSGSSTAQTLVFQLIVSDGSLASAPAQTTVTVNPPSTPPPPPPGGSNLALTATASASTQASGQEASKVRDGFTDGYPSNATHEWSTSGQGANAWVELTWPSAQTINQVVLFDRPNADDRVLSGTLTFSSGASVAVGALDNAGAALSVAVSSRSVTWVRFTVNSVSPTTYNVGLAELQVFNGSGTVNQSPVANAGANQSVAQGATVTLNGSGSDPEGAPITYDWVQTLGPAVLTVDDIANPTFVAPSGATTNVTLTFELVVSDGVYSSAPATVSVTVLAPNAPPPPPAGGANLALTATATASTQAGGQEASKIRDGFTDGYPADFSHEWASNGQGAGAWAQLTWPSAQTVSSVTLFDRPNSDDHVLSGTLTFSDGSSVAVGALTNAGAAVPVSFASRSVSWVRFTVSTVSGNTYNVGLAEFEVR